MNPGEQFKVVPLDPKSQGYKDVEADVKATDKQNVNQIIKVTPRFIVFQVHWKLIRAETVAFCQSLCQIVSFEEKKFNEFIQIF